MPLSTFPHPALPGLYLSLTQHMGVVNNDNLMPSPCRSDVRQFHRPRQPNHKLHRG